MERDPERHLRAPLAEDEPFHDTVAVVEHAAHTGDGSGLAEGQREDLVAGREKLEKRDQFVNRQLLEPFRHERELRRGDRFDVFPQDHMLLGLAVEQFDGGLGFGAGGFQGGAMGVQFLLIKGGLLLEIFSALGHLLLELIGLILPLDDGGNIGPPKP